MGLFNSSCCPSKPKRTMDYILNWIDTNSLIISKNTSFINDLIEWRRTIENDLYDHVKDVADEYITNYDWSEVPQFDVLSRSIATKADKTIPVEADSIALLDVNGNLKDSGVNVSNFAPASHLHDVIESGQAQVMCDNEGIYLNISDNGVTITYSNLVNLFRALQTPDNAPTEDSDNFVTSGGVKTALDGKAPANYVPWKIEKTTSEGTSRVSVDGEEIEFFVEDVTGDDPREVTAALTFSKMLNFERALRDPSSTPEDDNNKLITSKAVYDALANRAYSETLNKRKLQIGGIYLVKGPTLADYTIENISTSAMQSYISGIAEIGTGMTDHLVIGLKDGATTYELLSTVYVEDPNYITLYIGDITVVINRNSAQDAWGLGNVTKISSLF